MANPPLGPLTNLQGNEILYIFPVVGPLQALSPEPWATTTQAIADLSTGSSSTLVVSVFGRTGAVTAQTGDYTASQITGAFSNTLNSAFIFVGNASNTATGVAMSGDATINNAGAVTVSKSNGSAFAAGAFLGIGAGLSTSGGNIILTIPVPVASGGTNTASASGTALDNITGFSTNGIIERTGAGAYSILADPLTGTHGGTGVNNGASLIVIGGNVTFSGAFPFTATVTGSTNVTFPTSGTLATTTAANVSSVSNADGTLTISPNTGSVVASLALGHANTWSGPQTFLSGDLVLSGSSSGTTSLQASAVASGVLTLPAATDQLVGRATTDTLTNKSISGSQINSGLITGTVGGTGVNNGASLISIGGNLTFTGGFTFTGTLTNNTAVTFPVSGTLATTSAANVASVSNSDGTLTISPNTGSVVASLALGHANNWTAAQTFNTGSLKFSGSTSGTTTLNASASASGTLTLPAVTDTVAVLGTPDQLMAGGVNLTTFSYGTITSGTTSIDCGKNPAQYLINNGAFTLGSPSLDGTCLLLMSNSASAGAVTFSGFTTGSNTGDALTTTVNNKFTLSIWRINGISSYRVAALQ